MSDAGRPRRATSRRDPVWWAVPLRALVGITVVAGIDSWFLGVATMATDRCSPAPATCVPGIEIHQNLVGAAIATAVFFSALLIPLQHRKWQPLRSALQAAALLSAAWPAIWIVLLGGPTP